MSIAELRQQARELFGYLIVKSYTDLETIADQVDSLESDLCDFHGGGDAPTPDTGLAVETWASARLKELAKEAKEAAERVEELEARVAELEGELEEARSNTDVP
jgi:outer membrane murein-binding lipoprotein Lpp